jgi:hypothetical protein
MDLGNKWRIEEGCKVVSVNWLKIEVRTRGTSLWMNIGSDLPFKVWMSLFDEIS